MPPDSGPVILYGVPADSGPMPPYMGPEPDAGPQPDYMAPWPRK